MSVKVVSFELVYREPPCSIKIGGVFFLQFDYMTTDGTVYVLAGAHEAPAISEIN